MNGTNVKSKRWSAVGNDTSSEWFPQDRVNIHLLARDLQDAETVDEVSGDEVSRGAR